MATTIIDVFKILLVFSVHFRFGLAADHETVIDYKKTGLYDLKKADNSACKARVYCILPLSNPKSHLKIGITSVCQYKRNWIEEIPIGSDESVSVFVKAAEGDYFRAVLEELPGTCPTKRPVTTLKPEQECLHQLHRTKGFITYPDHPKSHDQKSMNCTYEFLPNPDYCGVKIHFKEFSFNNKNHITFKDPMFSTNTDIAGFSFTFKFPIYFSTAIVLSGDNSFNATYEYLKDCNSICSKDIKETTGIIKSPTDSMGYVNKVHCFYHFHQLPGYTKLKINIDRLKSGSFTISDNASTYFTLYSSDSAVDFSRTFDFHYGSLYGYYVSGGSGSVNEMIIWYTQTN